MNIKDIFSPVFFIVLGAAFLIVSVYALISRNKNAIRCKYKIGGMILSLSFFASSCSMFETTCYDPGPTCYAVAETQHNLVYPYTSNEKPGLNDSLFFHIYEPTYNYYSILLTDSTAQKTFRKNFLEYSEEKHVFFLPLNTMPEDYQGRFIVNIFGEESKELKQKNLIYTGSFILNPYVKED